MMARGALGLQRNGHRSPVGTSLEVERIATQGLLTWLGSDLTNLAQHDFNRVTEDGAEAVAYLMGRGKYADRNQYPFPALFLLDLKMRTMSGFEVLQWARSEPQTKELAIIVLTSSENSDDAKMAYHLGANSFLTKAHDFEQFVEQLNRLKGNWL